jgi:hypothetical protein
VAEKGDGKKLKCYEDDFGSCLNVVEVLDQLITTYFKNLII